MVPVGAVVADGNGEWCADAFLGAGKRGEVVVDEHMAAVAKGDGVGAALVVGFLPLYQVLSIDTIIY